MYNQVTILGNLTRDNELKYLPSSTAITNGAIATTHKYKMQDGTQKEEVCFLDFSLFGKSGEIFNQYTHKGSKVMLVGRLMFQQWKAQDGTNRSRHALNVTEFKFLDSKGDNQTSSHSQQNDTNQQHYAPQRQQMPQNNQQMPIDDLNDEIPF